MNTKDIEHTLTSLLRSALVGLDQGLGLDRSLNLDMDLSLVPDANPSLNLHPDLRTAPYGAVVGTPPLRIAHDPYGAPIALDASGTPDPHVLVSLSDEDDLAVCCWVRIAEIAPPPQTNAPQLVGLGIDLASPADFAGERGERFNHLLFSKHEQHLVSLLWPDDLALGYAFAFSAKEAAFKSCAPAYRAWTVAHGDDLTYDLMNFELVCAEEARGTLRHGRAQHVMDASGITHIALSRCEVGELACTLALALGACDAHTARQD